MFQKDYILRLIEACSIALGKIMGLKEKGENRQALEEIQKTYDEMLKVNIDEILSLPANQLKGIEIEKLEMISDLLKIEGEIEYTEDNQSRAFELFKKALELLLLVDNQHDTFSFDRKNKITTLKNLVK